MKKILALTLLMLMTAMPALAVRSVALMPSKIDVEEILMRNQKVYLSDIYVTNNNDFTMDVEMIAINPAQEELDIPSDWVKFKPQHFKLEPSGRRQIRVSVKIDKYAQNGDYRTFLKAKAKDDEVGNAIIPSVATVLTFKVEGGLVLGAAFVGSLKRGYGQTSSWFMSNWVIFLTIVATALIVSGFGRFRGRKGRRTL